MLTQANRCARPVPAFKALPCKLSCTLSRLPPCRSHASQAESTNKHSGLLDAAKVALASVAAAGILLTSPPAHAELQTVTATTATQTAKSLPQQQVDKGRIWFIMIGGAAALFGVTLLAEQNSAWFPAISKANQAMKLSTQAIENYQKEQEAAAKKKAAEEADIERQAKLVDQGLKEARNRLLASSGPQPPPVMPAEASPTPTPDTTATSTSTSTFPQVLDSPASSANNQEARSAVSQEAEPPASSSSFVVLDEAPLAGATSWSAASEPAASKAAAPAALAVSITEGTGPLSTFGAPQDQGAAVASADAAEAMARAARLQDFVGGVMTNSKPALEAMKAQSRK